MLYLLLAIAIVAVILIFLMRPSRNKKRSNCSPCQVYAAVTTGRASSVLRMA